MPNGKTKKIILVDRHALFRDAIAAYLAQEDDFVVCIAPSDGADALDYMQEEKPDVLLLNVSSTNGGGLFLLRRVKKLLPSVKIAADLHDSLGQLLMAWRIRVYTALNAADVSSVRQCLAPVPGEIADASDQLRTLIFDLSSPVLSDSGLSAALKDLAQRTDGKAGLTVTFTEDGNPRPVPEVTNILIYRATRELVHNTTKHSGGTAVTLAMSWKPSSIQVTVSDNGKGIHEKSQGRVSESGLFCIRERLARIGGRLHISSAPGAQCMAVIDIPTQKEG